MTLEAMCEHPAHRNVPCSIARCGQCDEQNAILRAAYKRHSESNSEHLERELASMTAARDYCLRTMNEAIEENTKLRSSTVEQLTKTWTGPTPTEGDLGPVEAAFLAHARRTWGTSTEMEEIEDSYFHFAAGYRAAPSSATAPLPGAIKLAVFLHETYERLAPEYGYETRADTRTFNASSPNGKLMIAVCGELRRHLAGVESTSAGKEKA